MVSLRKLSLIGSLLLVFLLVGAVEVKAYNSPPNGMIYPFDTNQKWQIISGYNDGNRHGPVIGDYDYFYSYYGFDFVRTDGPTAGAKVILPADAYYFRMQNSNELCTDFAIGTFTSDLDFYLELCHINFHSNFKVNKGSVINQFVPKGTELGTVGAVGDCPSCSVTPHIHMALHMSNPGIPWAVPNDFCASDIGGFCRFPVAFQSWMRWSFALSGDEYPPKESQLFQLSNQWGNSTISGSGGSNEGDPNGGNGGQTGNSHVDLFANANYGSTQYGWDDPTYGWVNVPDYLNNVASSIQLDGDWSIMVAQDPNGGGGRKCFASSHTDLVHAYYDNGVNINDTISSVVVYRNGSCDGQYTGVSAGDQVTLHVDINYTHTQYGVHDAVALNLPNYLTDNASAIGITPGWSVLVHDQVDGQGGSLCLTQSDPDLRDNYYDNGTVAHDSIASIRAFSNGNCSGWTSPLIPTLTPTYTPMPTITPTPLPVNNLLANAGFESLTDGWASPWVKDSTSISINTEGFGNEGVNSLRFAPTESNVHTLAPASEVQYGATYQLSQYVRVEPGSGEFGFYLDAYDANWNWLDTQQGSMWLGNIENPGSPIDAIYTFNYSPTTPNVAYVAVQYYMLGGTTFSVYVDSVALVQISGGSATATYTPSATATFTETPTETPTFTPTFTETPTVTPTPVPTNLVANPGFETTDAGSGFATVWSRDSETVTVDTGSQGNEGTNSLHFAPHTAESHAFSSGFAVAFGLNYTWSQYVKTTNAVGELGFYVDEYDAGGNWVSGQWLTQVWENVNGVVSINYTPSSASVASAALQYVFAGNYTMEAWVDSVSVTQAN